MSLKELWCDSLDLICLVQDIWVSSGLLVNMVMKLCFIEVGECLDKLIIYQLLNKDSAIWGWVDGRLVGWLVGWSVGQLVGWSGDFVCFLSNMKVLFMLQFIKLQFLCSAGIFYCLHVCTFFLFYHFFRKKYPSQHVFFCGDCWSRLPQVSSNWICQLQQATDV